MTEDASECCSHLENKLIEILENSLYVAYEEFSRKFDAIFVPLVKQYGYDEEKLVPIRKKYAKIIQEIIAQKLDDKLDTQQVQDKWSQITSIDRSLTQNKVFMQELKPLQSEYLSGLQNMKGKLVESRRRAKDKLINDAKMLDIATMLKTKDEMAQQLRQLCASEKWIIH